MNKEELLKILGENSKEYGDHEIAHINCDEALLNYINDTEITIAFNKGTKWYA